MNLRMIDWIWRIRGSLPVHPQQSPASAFRRIDGLLQEEGTSHQIDGDTLYFNKRTPLPQDPMSVFDSGTLQISDGTFHYVLKSRALLACFLAPLLFFAVGHLGVAMEEWRNPPELAAAKAEAAKKRSTIKPEDVPMNPVDAFLGAAKPEKKKDGEEVGKRNRKPSMKTPYVFMGIFFALWIIGRIFENVRIHVRFRKMLTDESAPSQLAEHYGRGYPDQDGVSRA